jgi:hypothetical protein
VSHARLDDWVDQDSVPQSLGNPGRYSSAALELETVAPARRVVVGSNGPRRTPRVSLILVLPDDQAVEPERLAFRLAPALYDEVDLMVVACAGRPSNLDELKRTARDARFLLAPAGTSAEDLRELAMEQTPGDIVTLLNGAHLCEPFERARVLTS